MKSEKGFTLIEVICGIILFALAGTMLISFVEPLVKNSIQPVLFLQDYMNLQKKTEDINARYTSLIGKIDTIKELQTYIDEENRHDTEYKYSISDYSGADDPDSKKDIKLLSINSNRTGRSFSILVVNPPEE